MSYLTYPSDAPTQELSEALPSILPDCEALVYEFVKAATEALLPNGQPALSFYADRARAAAEGLTIPVVRGWPAYPGKVPAIGVAAGTESEDNQHQTTVGGFAGTVYATDSDTGEKVGAADYYAEPLYVPVIVELIHENRDERDRLHNELRRILFPVRSKLPAAEPRGLIRKVTLDAQKDEVTEGPPVVDEPFTIYTSIFTVHVYGEMLDARNVTDQIIERVDAEVSPAP